MMQALDHTRIGRGKISDGFVGFDLSEVLILPNDVPLLDIPLQQLNLGDAFADVREFEFTCHALTSRAVEKGIESPRKPCCVLSAEDRVFFTEHPVLMPQSCLL
jgi:hypothetical protein